MRILVLGLSSIMRKRVLPAISKFNSLSLVDIASTKVEPQVPLPTEKVGELFSEYDDALRSSTAELVYISLVNSEHFRWAKRALELGKHVILDKPATILLEDAQELCAFAKEKQLCLAEATVYSYHPQIDLLKDFIARTGGSIEHIVSVFSFPPLAANNFRYTRELGGGALWDLGPYAVSPGRVFFGSEPERICCSVTGRGGNDGVDTSFSLMLEYPGGKSLIGHFGYTTEYQNRISVFGPHIAGSIERVFTPPDLPRKIKVRSQDKEQMLDAPAVDTFEKFLEAVFVSIHSGDHESFRRDLMSDARVLHQLRTAAGEK